jgi:hypothetical protein
MTRRAAGGGKWAELGLLAACGLVGCSRGAAVETGQVTASLRPDASAALAPVIDAAPDGSAELPVADAAPIAAALPDAGDGCATPRTEAWVGTAGRVNEHYPDNISVAVTWQRVASVGCVDRFAPTGTARYDFAIPGALCPQSTVPATAPIGATDGALAIDRTTSPATYSGRASTTWTVVWTCDHGDSSDLMTFEGGGLWFEAAGRIEGSSIAGAITVEDGRLCGRGDSSLPCTYTWNLAPSR